MSVIYRPRHEPYIPNGPSPAIIQTAGEENNLPAVDRSYFRFVIPVRRRSAPYFPLSKASIFQSAQNENDFPAKINRIKFSPQRKRNNNPYFPLSKSAIIQSSNDENDLPAIFANRWKFMSPVDYARVHVHIDYEFPGGIGPIPPVGSGNGMRPGRGRSPATRRYLFRPSPSGNPPRTPYRSAVTR